MTNMTYKGIYAMHKYWGKKPFNEISKFIERYTTENEVVLDSFCGSGVTLIEAYKANRRCIGVDLNPIALKLTKASLTAIDPIILTTIFAELKEKLKHTIDKLYTVEENGISTIVTHTIWKDNLPIEVWYTSNSSKKTIRPGRDIDITMALNPSLAPKWIPSTTMYENSRINVSENQSVSDLFTPRALVGLSLIIEEIQKISDEKIKNVFELTFSGTLSQASKLVFVIRNRKKNGTIVSNAEVGSWVIGYWMPKEHFEINVWNCFENRFKRILKGEQEIFELFKNRNSSDFTNDITLINGTATNLPLADNSVDYVFIDPPHANRILYIEQSLMWNAWLRLDENIDWDNEIIVTEAKMRKEKTAENYNHLLNLSFAEIKRVLKHNRYFSMAFNCLDDNLWLDTLNLFIKHGFEIDNIVPLEYSATSVVQDNRKNALKTDFVLTFRNVEANNQKEIIFAEDTYIEARIRAILTRNPEFEVYNIINALFEDTIPQGFIYRISHIVKTCATIM